MDEHRSVAGDHRSALRRQVNAVNKEGALIQETAALQSFERRRAKGHFGHLEVEAVLGEVDVAPTVFGSPGGGLVEGLVGHGKAGVQSESAADPRVVPVVFDEAQVFDQPCDGLLVTVAVRNLVAQRRRRDPASSTARPIKPRLPRKQEGEAW